MTFPSLWLRTCLESTHIEIINPHIERGCIRHALFDFDGTVSLIREGWQGVMIHMMVEILLETPQHESEEELRAVVTEFVDQLTGKQTIYQMIQLCKEVRQRGGEPLDPLEYKWMYLDRLWERIKGRVAGLKSGDIEPEEMMVPGAVPMLEALRARGVSCYLASGKDEAYVLDEAVALGLQPYFAGIYGALDDYQSYSKKMVIERIFNEHCLSCSELVTFGDGYVEIEDTKTVVGIAVGVASNEATRRGVNERKRRRLIEAGADIIVPDFRQHEQLVAHLFDDEIRDQGIRSVGQIANLSYPIFDRSRLKVKPLSERQHDMTLADVLPLDAPMPPFDDPNLAQVAERVARAHRAGAQVILMMGAHVIKCGLSRFVIDLMERGIITHVGMNGAGPIHDFELALIGATTESVARYIQEGQFGLWEETGRINEAIQQGARDGLGLGEAVGRMIEEERFPHRDVSILATGYRLRVPVTVHVGIGYDIIHEHPKCDGAALGETSYRDFLALAHSVSKLQGGVLLNFGTAVMGPEVFLKALAMARNVAHQEGWRITRFTTAVFDLVDLGPDYRREASKSDARYYFRPYKTLLVRTVQDGGESFYIRGDHRVTLPNLYQLIRKSGLRSQVSGLRPQGACDL